MSQQPELNFNRRHASESPAEVVEKIRKLLRMERGGTDAEVDNALRLARQLADKHNIDLASVDATESSPFSTLTHKPIRCALKSCDDDYASFIIQKFFNVATVFKEDWDRETFELVMDCVIIGTVVDVEIAEYVFCFLRSHFKACWRRRSKRIKKRKAFVEGVYLGICAKLREDRELVVRPEIRNALVLSRDAYLKKHFPNVQSVEVKSGGSNKSAAARNAGFGHGLQTNIRQPIAGSSAPSPLLLK